ncbi:apolipoprotein D-like protein, partial [Sarcoptes scabiei]
MIRLILSCLILGTVSFAQSQRFVSGPCPSIPSMTDFDKSKFLGHWIEVEKTPSIFDFMMRCLSIDYSGSEVTVIDTDYKEYAVVYSCTSSIIQGFYHTEYLWLLSRDGTLSNPTRQNIYETIDHLKINRVGLQLSQRSTCSNNTLVVTRESDQNLAAPVLLNNIPSEKAEDIKLTEDRIKNVENTASGRRSSPTLTSTQYLLTINPEVKTCLDCIYHGLELS